MVLPLLDGYKELKRRVPLKELLNQTLVFKIYHARKGVNMGKIIIFITIISSLYLYGCERDVSDSGAIIDLTKTIEELKEENIKLSSTLGDLKVMIDSQNDNIRDLDLRNTKLENELEKFNKLEQKINFSYSAVKELPEYKQLYGYLKKYDEKTNTLYIDTCEFLGLGDVDRIDELGLNPDVDFPSGFYIFDENAANEIFNIGENTSFYNYTFDQEFIETQVSKPIFLEKMLNSNGLVSFSILNGKIIEMSEQYLP